jgi:hypothetical protein
MKVRSFAVGAYVGRKAAGWPFGRLDVADDNITVRCWPLPWFGPQTMSKETIIEISLEKSLTLDHLKFVDSENSFTKVSVDLPVRSKRAISELKARGYPVVDRRPKMFPKGIVPWELSKQKNPEPGPPEAKDG